MPCATRPGASFDRSACTGALYIPKMVEAIEAVCDSCVRARIAPGIQTRTPALANFWKERGMLFLGCSNDTAMLYERAVELISQIGRGL